MPGDLVGGRYPLTYTVDKALGLAANATQGNISPRSNLEWIGFNDLTDNAASLVTQHMTVVAVPVEVGDVISAVSILAGATAESGGSHAWAACYAGTLTTCAILGAQSVDATGSAVVSASARHAFTLGTAFVVTNTNAPYGYIYAGVSVKGTVPSLVGGNIAVAVQYAYFTDSPPFFAAKFGSGLTGVAPASITLATATKLATCPAVILT